MLVCKPANSSELRTRPRKSCTSKNAIALDYNEYDAPQQSTEHLRKKALAWRWASSGQSAVTIRIQKTISWCQSLLRASGLRVLGLSWSEPLAMAFAHFS